MADIVSDFLISRLGAWGVTRIYGYPGDGINGITGALGRAGGRMRFIQVRHEEMAAFMACAHAKFTGEVGVCLATSGPGAIHLLNGLYDAQLDHQPVVAIVGQQARSALGGHYQQEVDLLSLFKDVAREYVHMATVPEQILHLVDRAIRIARVARTVTCIILPNDLQELDAVVEPPRAHGTIHSGVGLSMPRVIPADLDLSRAADLLNAGERVAVLVGAGAQSSLSDGREPGRRQRGNAPRIASAAASEDRSVVARTNREKRGGLVGGPRGPRDARRRSHQPAAGLLGNVVEAAGQLHSVVRLRHRGQLVRARCPDPSRHDGLAVGHTRDHGAGRAVRHRGEVLPSRTRGHRDGG